MANTSVASRIDDIRNGKRDSLDEGSPQCIKLRVAICGTMRSQRLDVLAQVTGSTQFKYGGTQALAKDALFRRKYRTRLVVRSVIGGFAT